MSSDQKPGIRWIEIRSGSEIDIMKSMYHKLLESNVQPEVLLLGLPFYLAELMREMREDDVLMWLTNLAAAVVMCHRYIRQSHMMYS